jgi:hypothetical protein
VCAAVRLRGLALPLELELELELELGNALQLLVAQRDGAVAGAQRVERLVERRRRRGRSGRRQRGLLVRTAAGAGGVAVSSRAGEEVGSRARRRDQASGRVGRSGGRRGGSATERSLR